MSAYTNNERQRSRELLLSMQRERTPEEVDAVIDEIVDEIIAENEAKWAIAKRSVMGVLRLWRPDGQWLVNEVSASYHDTSDDVRVEVCNNEDLTGYYAEITGLKHLPTQRGIGASVIDAVFDAYMNMLKAEFEAMASGHEG